MGGKGERERDVKVLAKIVFYLLYFLLQGGGSDSVADPLQY